MSAKRSGTRSKEELLANLQRAIQEYVDGNGGKLWQIQSITIVPHNPTSFDLVIPCVGHKPAPD